MSEKKDAKKAAKAEKKAAKKGRKGGDKAFKIIIAIVLVVAIVGELYMGFAIKNELSAMNSTIAANAVSNEGGSSEPAVTLTPGTYGGVEFKTNEDVVNYYNDAYNKTKAKTMDVKNSNGDVETLYGFIGEENLQIKEGSLLVDGSANAMLNGMVPGILGNIFHKNICALPPQSNRHPADDKDSAGASLSTSRVVVDDILGAKVEDNGDGTITLTLIPVKTEMSEKGMDSQGHFFNSLGALDSVVGSISVLSFSQGGASDNVKATYEGGQAVVKIDTASGEIVEADYNMVVNVDVQHANVTVLKDKSAALTILYDNHFPVDKDGETWKNTGYTPV